MKLIESIVKRVRPLLSLSLVLALVFFFLPTAAFLAGVRAKPFENHPLAWRPSITAGWDFPRDFDAWAIDHLPLRQSAIQVDNQLRDFAFGPGRAQVRSDSANGRTADKSAVLVGKNGWLYYGGDFDMPCSPVLDVKQIVDGLAKLEQAANASGRNLVVSVPPDKSTLDPQNLPVVVPNAACASARKAEFWRAVESSDVSVVDMRDEFRSYQSSTGAQLYFPLDTHWTMLAAAMWVRDVVARIDPALDPGPVAPNGSLEGNSSGFVSLGTVSTPGDLTILQGSPRDQDLEIVTVRRPGVTVYFDGKPVLPEDLPALVYDTKSFTGSTADSTQSPLINGNTLVFGDSF
ncbi:MAG: hypothetical protein WA988_12320, partial [Candidatus Nanopelagicales bacterium]